MKHTTTTQTVLLASAGMAGSSANTQDSRAAQMEHELQRANERARAWKGAFTQLAAEMGYMPVPQETPRVNSACRYW